VENIEKIMSGDADLALVQNDVLDYAFHGTNIWQDKPPPPMSRPATLYPEICQLIVPAIRYQNVADLAGKRVSVGGRRFRSEVTPTDSQAYGLGWVISSWKKWTLPPPPRPSKRKASTPSLSRPVRPIRRVMDLQADCPLRIIGLDEEEMENIVASICFIRKPC
jgi:hypothetical protein